MIPEDEWETIVSQMPIPSVDMVVLNDDDEFLLGRRQNQPAKGTWFVPGGRILKNEQVYNAVHRKAREELNTAVSIEDDLGWYEHFYDESDVGADVSKHYIALCFVVRNGNDIEPDSQHEELEWFSEPPKATHRLTMKYLEDAGVTSS